MKFLEKDLEDLIFGTSAEQLRKRGYHITNSDFAYRQLNLGSYGIADIVQVSIDVQDGMTKYEVVVHELKKDRVDEKSFWQALRYLKGLVRLLRNNTLSQDIMVTSRIILCGKSIDLNSSLIYLSDFIYGQFEVYFYTYEYEFDGLKFKSHQDYSMISENFPSESLSDLFHLESSLLVSE